MSFIGQHLIWLVVTTLGASAFATVVFAHGETISALWVMVAAVCIYLIAYHYYSRLIADRVLGLDGTREAPAWHYNDGLNYVPTSKHVSFGYHFVAIVGAGLLVGPVLTAQMGYLPGMLWILVDVVFAGVIQDSIMLFISGRRNGRLLDDLVRSKMGIVPGMIALFGAFLIMIITLAVLTLVVAEALVGSPWSTFTVVATTPAALFMGVHVCYVRPGRIGEISIIGFVLLMLAVISGQVMHENAVLASLFVFNGRALTQMLIGYDFVVSVLPVWLLLVPCDYLSTLLKIGMIMTLTIGILIVAPQIQMLSLTQLVGDDGPIWSDNIFPLLSIATMYGTMSGSHSLIAPGATPKSLENERQVCFIGYDAMSMESLAAIIALMTASIIDPGVYFVTSSPAVLVGVTPDTVAHTLSTWGFVISPDVLIQTIEDIGGSTILAHTGDAPTLAVGMTHILHQVVGGQAMMTFWCHFVILFEALFILTVVDADTRAGRFMSQDLLGTFVLALKCTDSLVANLIATVATIALWGCLLYQDVVDPLGDINTLWPLLGVSNQMLAVTALTLDICALVKMKCGRYVRVTLLSTLWLLLCTFAAGWQKLLGPDPKIGSLAYANKYANATTEGKLLTPARSMAQIQQAVLNGHINAFLCGLFILVVVNIAWYGLRMVLKTCTAGRLITDETPYEALGT